MDVDQKSPNMPALSREPRPNPNTPALTVSDHRPYTHSVSHQVLLPLAQAVCLIIYTKWAILLFLPLMVIVEMVLAEFLLPTLLRLRRTRHGAGYNYLAMKRTCRAIVAGSDENCG